MVGPAGKWVSGKWFFWGAFSGPLWLCARKRLWQREQKSSHLRSATPCSWQGIATLGAIFCPALRPEHHCSPWLSTTASPDLPTASLPTCVGPPTLRLRNALSLICHLPPEWGISETARRLAVQSTLTQSPPEGTHYTVLTSSPLTIWSLHTCGPTVAGHPYQF